MKIAILHNFMDNIGGAEIVTLRLARELNADVYTTNINHERIASVGFGDVVPRIHSVGTVPVKAPFRHQMALWRMRRLNLGKQYDRYIICGDWAVSAAVNNRPNLWYVHGPLNELWAFKKYVQTNMMAWWKRPIFELWVALNRWLTVRYSKQVDIWVCNSKNSQDRIRRYYKKEATIINPPIDTGAYSNAGDSSDQKYWLSVNRLLDHKRVDIQMRAFSALPEEKLIVVGSYEKGADHFEHYRQYIESIKPGNVELKHWVPEDELLSLYAGCKGFITTSRDEDFGMTVVEAMASGKPVIAPREGGYKESVIESETGILIDDIDDQKLIDAIKRMSAQLQDPLVAHVYKEKCQARAREFDTSVFMKKIRALLDVGTIK